MHTIRANLWASDTRSVSIITSSSWVGKTGNFFPIKCSMRWKSSTSYLKKENCHGSGWLTMHMSVHSKTMTQQGPQFSTISNLLFLFRILTNCNLLCTAQQKTTQHTPYSQKSPGYITICSLENKIRNSYCNTVS